MQAVIEALNREAEDALTRIGLPPCPAVLAGVVREMRNDDPDFEKLNRLISGDVTLAAAMLKTVNSPFYGLRTKIVSIRQALTMLGLRNVSSLVTGLLLRQALPAATGKHMEEFWERSSGNARGCAFLARRLKLGDAEEAYTFGLFRDCGIPAMAAGVKGYHPEYAMPVPGELVTADENRRFRMNHAVVGAALAKSWYLPESISLAVQWHHEYAAVKDGAPGVPERSVKLIALALAGEEIYLRHVLGLKAPEWAEHGAWALEEIGLDEADVEEMADDVAAAVQSK